jgi:hypothetical protein
MAISQAAYGERPEDADGEQIELPRAIDEPVERLTLAKRGLVGAELQLLHAVQRVDFGDRLSECG